MRELRAAVSIRPSEPDAVYNLGVMLGETGKRDEATTWLKRARQLGPDRADLSYNLVRAELAGKHGEEAVAEVEHSAARFGRDAQWRTAIGELFLRNHQLEEAIRQLSAIPDPTDVSRRLLAAAYLQSGKPQKVAAALGPPSTAEDHFLLASAAFMDGDFEQALRDSEQSLSGDGNQPRYIMLNAQLNQRLGRHEAALNALAILEAGDSQNAEAHYREAVSRFFLGEYNESRRALDDCMHGSAASARIAFLYAMTYENQSQWDQEIQWLRKSLAAEPSNARFHTHLGFALVSRS